MLNLIKSGLAFSLCSDYNFDDGRSESVGNSYAFIHQVIVRSIFFARMNVKNLSDQQIMDLVVPKQQLLVMRQSNEFAGLIADLAQ
ncbi:MAG TPA: hypothetical protein DIW47_06140 [Bacteroidetes bacterium]|nr:hypothetical protein [Bacteroidota bacterium]